MRAQVKMFETLAVLVVFFFFLIFGASFYFKLQENALHRELDKNTQLRAIQIAQKSIHLPELDCSFAGVQRQNCVDLLKVQLLASRITASDTAKLDYFNTFEYSTLTFTEVYPDTITYIIYDKPQGDSVTTIQIPVVAYRATDRGYAFGYLEVRVYA